MSISKYLTEKRIYFLIILFLLFLISFRLINSWAFPDTAWQLQKGNKTTIGKDELIIQKFQAPRNNLTRIDVFFGSTNIKPGGKIFVQIFDENCNEMLREKSLKVSTLDSDKTYDFYFNKIKDSKDKIYCLKIGFDPLSVKKKANIFLLDNPPSQSKFFSLNGQEIPNQSVAMRPAYQNDSWLGNIAELNQRISQYKPWFLKNIFLYIITFGFIILSVVLVLILILL